MNICAFIVARLTSTRLPEKHLKTIGDRPLIQWITDRLKKSRFINRIVITSVDEPENRKFMEVADTLNVDLFLFKGDVDNVTGRMVAAAERYEADICLLISGDCPLIDVESIDRGIETLQKEDGDIVCFLGKNGKPAIHEGIVISPLKSWKRADNLSNTPFLRENQFPILWRDKNRFKPVEVKISDVFTEIQHRISVDTSADLRFMNRIFELLSEQNKEFNLENTVELLQLSPDLKEINRSVHQKQQGDVSMNILFVVSAGGKFGLGNLMRSLHLAELLTEKSHSVSFSVPEEDGIPIIEKYHFKGSVDKNWGRNNWNNADIVVFDINSSVELVERPEVRTVIIDNINGIAEQADLVIIPTTYHKDPVFDNMVTDKLIIRREVQEIRNKQLKKDIDVLIYSKEHYKPSSRDGIWVKVDSFQDDFLELLARSRTYKANFGYSFYEALYLGAQPEPIRFRNKKAKKEFKAFSESVKDCPQIKDSSEEIVELILKS